MALTRIILVRHGETQANREDRYSGTDDVPLTDVGHTQARDLSQTLSDLAIAAIYSSPKARAIHTAQPIAARQHLPVHVVEDLRECHFGQWEGLNRAEILVKSPSDAERYHAWQHDVTIAPPDGESTTAMHRRVQLAVAPLRHAHAGQTIVLVTHIGPIKALLCEAVGAPISSLFHLFLDVASLSLITWQESHPVVRLLNAPASGHLLPNVFRESAPQSASLTGRSEPGY